MAGKATIEGVKSGVVTSEDLMKINALIDAQAYQTGR